jgi:hypothetical protein
MRVYSIVALLFCCAMIYGARLWYRKGSLLLKHLMAYWVTKVVLTLDILDQVVDAKGLVRERFRKRWIGWKERTKDHDLALACLFGLILFYSAALRYADIFSSSAFLFSDPYSHLLWMKQLESGVLYPAWDRNQYYPKGLHAFSAILHGLTGLDGPMTIRLVGPLVSVLLVISVYYGGKRLTGNSEAALVGMFVFGTFIEPLIWLQSNHFENGIVVPAKLAFPQLAFPQWFERQSAALPEEFGFIFLVLALFSAYSYLTERNRRALFCFCLASITVFMTHPLVAAALGVGLAALVGMSFLLRVLTWRTFITLSSAALVASVLGSLHMLYGWLWDDSVKKAAEHYATAWLGHFERIGALPYTMEILANGALGLLFLVGGIVLAEERRQKLLWGFFGLYLILLVLLGRSVNFGIRYLIGPDRLDNYRIFFLSTALAGMFHLATFYPVLRHWYRKNRWLYQSVTALSLVILGVIGYPSNVSSLPGFKFRYEYDALARISYKIKRSFPSLEWTIVSTTEDYSKVFMEKGWHMNVGEFLDRYSPYEQTSGMPTPYTFLFVEKRLFGSSSDPSLNAPGARLDLQRRLHEWSHIYQFSHANSMSTYYEDWDVIVYLITRNQETAEIGMSKNKGGPGRRMPGTVMPRARSTP